MNVRLSWPVALLVVADVAQAPNRLTPAEVKQGWVLLFDGKTTRGWAPNTGASAAPEWKAGGGTLNPPEGPVCWYVSTRAFKAYEVRGEAWSETKTGAMLGIAESHKSSGGRTEYSSVKVFSSNPTATGKWISFRFNVTATSASLSWQGQAAPETGAYSSAGLTHFQLGYFGPGKVRFRNLKLLPAQHRK
jgi:hypothetical protein